VTRFDSSRRARILAWTGAALAWGTAVTMAGLEPEKAAASTSVAPAPPAVSGVVPASQVAAMPAPPAQGLVILRYQPSVDTTPEVRTVYVRQKAPQAATAARTTAAPAPQSSGS
jgi:hypothetical protein